MAKVNKLELGRRVSERRSAAILRGGRMAKTSRGVVSFAPAIMAGGVLLFTGSGAYAAEACPAPIGGPEGTTMCDLGIAPGNEQDPYAWSRAFGVSGDGFAVAGSASTPDGSVATVWVGNSIEMLSKTEAQTSSEAFGISADGGVVVGYARVNNGAPVAASWSTDGIRLLGTLDGFKGSKAFAANTDGSVIVGVLESESQYRAFRWENDTFVSLGTLDGFYRSQAASVSADGSVVVGYAANNNGGSQAFRWDESGGMRSLGLLGNSKAHGISADGTLIVGELQDVFGKTGFRMNGSEYMRLLALEGDAASAAYAISSDGKVVVGQSTDTSVVNSTGTAVLWGADYLPVSLGVLEGGNTSRAFAVNEDGSVVVGVSNQRELSITAWEQYNDRAFIWRSGGTDNAGVIQDYANLMASFPILANDTELAVATQQWSLGSLLDQTGFVGAEGRNYFAASTGASNMGSDVLSQSQANQIASLTFGRGISAELTVGGSLQVSGGSNDASGFDGDRGTGVSAWAEYSETGLERTGLQSSFALGYAAQGNAIIRGTGLTDVEAATGAGDLETLAARLSVGYGIKHASGWLLTPHAAISHFNTSREAYAEDPTATAFSASYDDLSVASTVGTAGVVGQQMLSETSSFILGAGADFDIDAEETVLTGSANIPGMETFDVTSTLVRNDVRPFVTADYSVDLAEGGTFTASARLGKAVYGNEADFGIGVRYGISF